METLNLQLQIDCPSEYFLTFSSKDEYLRKREEWKTLYKWLSKVIRHNKAVFKSRQKATAKIEKRMAKKGWVPWNYTLSREEYSTGLSEFKDRVKTASSGIPEEICTRRLDPTLLLKIRKKMKEESSRQRKP
jgi:hypothetical protein